MINLKVKENQNGRNSIGLQVLRRVLGKAMTETFIHSGYRVIGAARRLEKTWKT